MKNILILLMTVFAFASCSKNTNMNKIASIAGGGSDTATISVTYQTLAGDVDSFVIMHSDSTYLCQAYVSDNESGTHLQSTDKVAGNEFEVNRTQMFQGVYKTEIWIKHDTVNSFGIGTGDVVFTTTAPYSGTFDLWTVDSIHVTGHFDNLSTKD